ncbi:Poly [ADP-ribose] polymerase 1 [Trichoplax sp. H2]|nr:Poly [ADP-ribose] polymerase 1 [Trichoplax sp. H2]|eukprot:RDD36839.1 Poly [ADP-ribose] polymerase 1 [Trichoplax sp. H2]
MILSRMKKRNFKSKNRLSKYSQHSALVESESMEDRKTALKEQAILLQGIFDKLTTETNEDMIMKMLEYNIELPEEESANILELCIYGMAFGAELICPRCRSGTFYDYVNRGKTQYKACNHPACNHKVKRVDKKSWKVPDDAKARSPFLYDHVSIVAMKFQFRSSNFSSLIYDIIYLREFTFVPHKRIPTEVLKGHQVLSTQGNELCRGKLLYIKPLGDIQISIIGNLKRDKLTAIEQLEYLGASIHTKISSYIDLCICSLAELESNHNEWTEMKNFKLPIVAEEFIDSFGKSNRQDLNTLILKYNIADWISKKDIKIASRRYGYYSTKVFRSSENPITDSLKGLHKKFCVLEESGNLYSTVVEHNDDGQLPALTKLQALAHLTSDMFCVVIIDNDEGSLDENFYRFEVQHFYTKEEAKLAFQLEYYGLTGNRFGKDVEFKLKIDRGFPTGICSWGFKDSEAMKLQQLLYYSPSERIKGPIHKLLQLLFDVKAMQFSIVQSEIDAERLKLKDLTADRLVEASKLLDEIAEIKKSCKTEQNNKKNKLKEIENRIKKLCDIIPRKPFFDLTHANLSDLDDDLIQCRYALEDLKDILVAYELLEFVGKSTTDPISSLYQRLKTNIEAAYARNGFRYPVNKYYSISVEEVFKINSKRDDEKFKAINNTDNRMLLWHGFRTINYAQILSQGIKPVPEKLDGTKCFPVGKALYFTDIMWESASRCETTASNPVGLLLLCEVALGKMHKMNIESCKLNQKPKLPEGTDSFKAVGGYGPDPAGNKIIDDGITVPLGKIIPIKAYSPISSRYVVYNMEKVQIRYLVQVKFDYFDV